MITKAAIQKVQQEEESASMPTDVMAAISSDFASLKYRSSEEGLDKNTASHIGKFNNRFVVFGKFSKQDRALYMLRFQKYLDLKAALNGINDKELEKEAEAEAIIHALLTMSDDGFTTKELTTQRVYESGGRPRESPGFWTGIKRKMFGKGSEQPEVAQGAE